MRLSLASPGGRRPSPISILSTLLLVLHMTTFVVAKAQGQDPTDDPDDSSSTTSTTSTPSSTSSTSTTTTPPPTTSTTPTSTEAAPTGSVSSFSITEAPSIAGVGIPTMKVPDTSNAPFMQRSNLPEGTVFICVGAALGAMGAALLAWRGMVAWSLHRSVQRAAMTAHTPDAKPMLRPPGGRRRSRGATPSVAMYSTTGRNGSMMSIDNLAHTGSFKPGSRGNPPSAAAGGGGRSSLFFSPTAGGAAPTGTHNHTSSVGNTAGLLDPRNRSSGFLPAGYYTAGSSAPAGGASSTHLGGAGSRASYVPLSDNGSHSRLGARSVSGPSPPGSPGLPPSRGGDSAYDQPASNHLNLNAPPQGRAPSAYLEDLFENHGNGPRERF